MTNLKLAIHYLQQSIRHQHSDDPELIVALDILCNKEWSINIPVATSANTVYTPTPELVIKPTLDTDCGESQGCENCVCSQGCTLKIK